MSRHETSPTTAQPAGNNRPNACCFCWCCCCSCSWNEDPEQTRRTSRDTKLETIPNCEACTKPTTEEMRTWAQSFDKLMKNPAGRNVFREFLRTEYSEENMLFWLACEDLKKEAGKNATEEKARMIYEDYISILSPKEGMPTEGLCGIASAVPRPLAGELAALVGPVTLLGRKQLRRRLSDCHITVFPAGKIELLRHDVICCAEMRSSGPILEQNRLAGYNFSTGKTDIFTGASSHLIKQYAIITYTGTDAIITYTRTDDVITYTGEVWVQSFTSSSVKTSQQPDDIIGGKDPNHPLKLPL
nr:PREDICTED: regulator of G-protein signaling 19 [Latimeria chalumnae]|eukprot:XP_014353066.1 PREDICTED: regulator of G-protein signaling 19 [Latimeria chalumnae]